MLLIYCIVCYLSIMTKPDVTGKYWDCKISNYFNIASLQENTWEIQDYVKQQSGNQNITTTSK